MAPCPQRSCLPPATPDRDPPRRLAAFLRAPAAHAVGLGALAALGQAPWGLWPLTILSLAALAVLVARAPGVRAAFWRGWFAGAAQFGVALGWVVEPFFVEPAVTGWMAPFAVVLLAGGLALFWGGAALIAAATNPRGVRRVWIFVLAMLAFEDLRGYLFTGFPWTLSGHIWIGWPPDQIAALGGALLLGALTLGLSAALATVFLRWRQGRRRRAMVVLATAALALGWRLGLGAGAAGTTGAARARRAIAAGAGQYPAGRQMAPRSDRAVLSSTPRSFGLARHGAARSGDLARNRGALFSRPARRRVGHGGPIGGRAGDHGHPAPR